MGQQCSYASRIAALASQRPDDPVVRIVGLDGDGRAYAWPELHRRSSQVAGALAARGVGVGDRVALGLRNSVELVVSVFAAWKLGATPVPMRWDLPAWELERVRRAIDPKVSLGPEDLDWIHGTSALAVPTLPDVVPPVGAGICSSGSTGTPKVILGGMPPAYDPAYGTPRMAAWTPVPRPETVLVMAPMYHANGLATLLNLLAGDSLVIMERFDAARVVDVVERHRISTFTATPTMLQRIADVPGVDDRDLSSIVWFTQGAAPMPPSLVHRWADLVGAERILMAYGMTEALGLTMIRGDEWMDRPGSVGRGVKGTELRVLDAEGRELPPGETGEIYLRSPATPATYLGDVPALPSTPDGFRTVGDVGYLDEDGYLYLVDRRVDMIVTGGANVFPAEVESALVDHAKIADVVVIGLADPDWGRRVHAVIEPADPSDPPSADEVVAYAKARLAAYKVPKTVEVVGAIPRSEATKVNRRALVEERGG